MKWAAATSMNYIQVKIFKISPKFRVYIGFRGIRSKIGWEFRSCGPPNVRSGDGLSLSVCAEMMFAVVRMNDLIVDLGDPSHDEK